MDTLSFHKQRPLLSHIDLTNASLVYVMGQYKNARKMLNSYEGEIKATPEKEALWFYLQNHTMALVKKAVDNQEPLGEFQHFVEVYHADINRKMIRMFYYLLLICTRESRHMQSGPGRAKLWKKYPNILDFHSAHIQDKEHADAIDAIMVNAPDITLGEYTDFLVDAFTLPSYSGGFGGKKWKEVAGPLRDFVHGKITAEMLMDTAFTLAHNNGPIFNKGMLFNTYNPGELIKILDVQRSGQIPQYIDSHDSKSITVQMKEYVQAFSKLCGDIRGTVNWNQVKTIKGLLYNNEIKKQDNENSSVDILAKLKMKAIALKAVAAQTAIMKGSVEIMPGVYVAKSERSLS